MGDEKDFVPLSEQLSNGYGFEVIGGSNPETVGHKITLGGWSALAPRIIWRSDEASAKQEIALRGDLITSMTLPLNAMWALGVESH